MQPLQICIGPIIRIGRESWCLPYAGFLLTDTLVRSVMLQWGLRQEPSVTDIVGSVGPAWLHKVKSHSANTA